jgi:hypothetical protein
MFVRGHFRLNQSIKLLFDLTWLLSISILPNATVGYVSANDV